MRAFTKSAFVASLTFGVFFAVQPAKAVVMVIGEGFAHECFEAADAVSKGAIYIAPVLSDTLIEPHPIEVCDIALRSMDLSQRDRAATHVNRGVLKFIEKDYNGSLEDFDDAISADDDIGEAYANRGAALVALKRYSDSIPSINKGLELMAGEPEKSFYNRAIAYEETGNVKGAYYDYLKAAEIKPDWEAPRNQLTRFTVKRKTQ